MKKKTRIIVALFASAVCVCAIGALFLLIPEEHNVFDPLFIIGLLAVLYCIFAGYIYWKIRFYEEGTELTPKNRL